ncbi:MAG: type 2 isopentenyl-diphosphate Delta-isomerase [Promethearchaeota archaeon]
MSGETGPRPSDRLPSRKLDHLRAALEFWRGEAPDEENPFDQLAFVHDALPEVDLEDVDTRVEFLGRNFSHPLVLSATTGGHPALGWFNEVVGALAEEFDVPVGVGSQRAALEDEKLSFTFSAVRRRAPRAFVLANVGACQLATHPEPEELAARCVEMVRADAVAVHLNAVQELLQPGGDANFKGVVAALAKVVEHSNVPVLVKEVGCGISGPVAAKLEATGVAAVDVAGSGGTNFAAIEARRAGQAASPWNSWGIPTPVAIAWCRKCCSLPLVGSGGVRHGLDVAKALASGATVAGLSGALLPHLLGHWPVDGDTPSNEFVAAAERSAGVFLARTCDQVRRVMAALGCRRVEHLYGKALVAFGRIREWRSQLAL